MTDRIKQAPSGKIVGYRSAVTLTYGAIADEGLDVQSGTITGLKTTDNVSVNPTAALPAGVAIAFARVSAANTIDVGIACFAAAGVTPGAVTFNVIVTTLAT